jgi:acetyltransferase-like isoleucine patch superfamily enzyme
MNSGPGRRSYDQRVAAKSGRALAAPEAPGEAEPPVLGAGRRRGPGALLLFLSRNRMLTPKYGLLLLRYLRRRFLTAAGYRWRTDGPLFLGPRLQIQISRRGRVSFGRFVWVGHGSKIRCHEGEVSIGAKTVIGQECTISAYRRVRIGEQCVIADRAMFIDFDHAVVDVERPVRQQGIYTREVEVGSNVWIGYGACILRGVRVGDNAIVGANAVVTRDVPANAVVAGVPARVLRMREPPGTLRWPNPVEPDGGSESLPPG